MAQLEQSGFSAVDEFFGVDNDTLAKESTHEPSATVLTNSTGRKRLGVGASSTNKEETNLSIGSKWQKQIFQVGKKRHRQDNEEDDVDEETDVRNDDHTINEEDDDEDVGRTAISSEKKTIGQSIPLITEAPKKKKKKGKKERMKERGEEIPSQDTEENNSTQKEVVDIHDPNDDTEGNKKKRKRRKVRSRQKNIRKDNREHKPEHLIVGSKDYQGRPLTAETRKRLNLPVSNAREKFQKMANKWSNSEEASESEPVQTNEDVPKPASNSRDSPSEMAPNPSSTIAIKCERKKKSKSKYKNLM